MKRDDLVVVRTYTDEMQAVLAKGILESEGIPSTVRNVHSVADDVLHSVNLLVQPMDFERAATILEDMEQDGDYDADADDDTTRSDL